MNPIIYHQTKYHDVKHNLHLSPKKENNFGRCIFYKNTYIFWPSRAALLPDAHFNTILRVQMST